MRFSILNAVCMGTTFDEAWIVRESETLGSLRHHVRVCEHSCMAGHVGLVGLGVFAVNRGTHKRGIFSSILRKDVVMI